jgi:hypothetical protein
MPDGRRGACGARGGLHGAGLDGKGYPDRPIHQSPLALGWKRRCGAPPAASAARRSATAGSVPAVPTRHRRQGQETAGWPWRSRGAARGDPRGFHSCQNRAGFADIHSRHWPQGRPKRYEKTEEKLRISGGRSAHRPTAVSVESRTPRSLARAPSPVAMPMQKRRMAVRKPRNSVSWKGMAGFRITEGTAASTPRDAPRSAPSRC